MTDYSNNPFGARIDWDDNEVQNKTADTPKSAIATWDNAGLPQEMTGTQGDILYFGADGVVSKLSASTSGNILQTNGAGVNPSWVTPPNAAIFCGYHEAATANNTGQKFESLCAQEGSLDWTTTEAAREIVIPRNGVLRNFFVRVGANTSAGTNTFTIRKNGADTALTVSFLTTVTGNASDTANTVAVSAGDRLCLANVTTNGTGNLQRMNWSVEFGQ